MAELNPIEWAIRPLQKYAVFSGRAPRAEYWWYTLATAILGFLVDFLDKVAGDTSLISGAFNLALIVPGLAVTVRRLHDTDRGGWWLLTLLIPIVIVGVAVGIAGKDFASGPLGLMGILMIIGVVALTILGIILLVFMITPGTEGPNRYGPDPYGPDQLEEVFA